MRKAFFILSFGVISRYRDFEASIVITSLFRHIRMNLIYRTCCRIKRHVSNIALKE